MESQTVLVNTFGLIIVIMRVSLERVQEMDMENG